MSSSSNVEMGSVNRLSYGSLRNTDPIPEWPALSAISSDLANACFASPPQQKMVVIGEMTVPQQELIDRIIKFRPKLASMTWNGEYLTIARRIKSMADEVGYQPKTSLLTCWIEKCFVCTLTSGCRERTLLKEGRLTEKALSDWQFWDDYAKDLASIP